MHNIEHSQVLQLQLEYMLIELQWALDRTLTCNLLLCVSYKVTELRGVAFNNEGNHYGHQGTSTTTLASIY